ncbi:hypothetical protein LTR92_002560 [Exophiala xenobiotica]|nr:hypothetical protein LTR92_002560 [Exophiala xenobiotica]
MYRKRNGSLGFSFTRFAHAAVPNFFADESPVRTAELTAWRRDMCYMHQIASGDGAYALDERSFYVAGVVDSEGVSKKVYKALRKNGILREEEGRRDGGAVVDTHGIGVRFPHQLAMLNIVAQKDLVGMLFWWEEECQRLRKLDDEERELDGLVGEAELELELAQSGSGQEGEGVDGDGDRDRDRGAVAAKKVTLDRLKFARERVRMKRRQRPSQRRVDVEEDRDDIVMAYHGRSRSVPNMAGHDVGMEELMRTGPDGSGVGDGEGEATGADAGAGVGVGVNGPGSRAGVGVGEGTGTGTGAVRYTEPENTGPPPGYLPTMT